MRDDIEKFKSNKIISFLGHNTMQYRQFYRRFQFRPISPSTIIYLSISIM